MEKGRRKSWRGKSFHLQKYSNLILPSLSYYIIASPTIFPYLHAPPSLSISHPQSCLHPFVIKKRKRHEQEKQASKASYHSITQYKERRCCCFLPDTHKKFPFPCPISIRFQSNKRSNSIINLSICLACLFVTYCFVCVLCCVV